MNSRSAVPNKTSLAELNQYRKGKLLGLVARQDPPPGEPLELLKGALKFVREVKPSFLPGKDRPGSFYRELTAIEALLIGVFVKVQDQEDEPISGDIQLTEPALNSLQITQEDLDELLRTFDRYPSPHDYNSNTRPSDVID